MSRIRGSTTPRLDLTALSGKLVGWKLKAGNWKLKGRIHDGGPGRLVACANVCPAIYKDRMKRHGNLFPAIVARENIERAYVRAKKHKTWQRTIKRVEADRENAFGRIQRMLKAGTFQTAPYRLKRIYEPKVRDIYILPFYPDRIVQHAVMNILEPIWTALFIRESYACITNRGLHAGSRKTMGLVRQYGYCLKCDISKFYPSIVHDILFEILKRKIKCPPTLDLLHNIIYSIDGATNVPIGNYTSQWFGNLYLNELDMFVKHELRVKGYVRYCDDFCLFSDSKHKLQEWRRRIDDFIGERLGLRYSKDSVFPVKCGVDFLGYRHFPNKILLRKSTAKRVKKRLARLPWQYRHGKITLEQYRSSVASTWGWLKWANTHNFQLAVRLEELQKDVNEQRKKIQ